MPHRSRDDSGGLAVFGACLMACICQVCTCCTCLVVPKFNPNPNPNVAPQKR